MTTLLLLVLVITEAAFVVSEFAKQAEKREWNQRRMIVNLLEFSAFLVMLLLPGIDLSFRFMGLFLILIVRVIVSVLGYFIGKKNTKTKTKSGMIMSCILSVLILVSSMTPAFLFKDYKGRPVSGALTPTVCSAILTDNFRTEQFENDGSLREIPVHFYYPAETNSIAEHSLPLVIFSHGAFGWYQSNTSTYMELASHGYVVVSLDHPYHSFFTKDTKGNTIIVDREFIQSAMMIGGDNNPLSDEETYEITSVWMQLRKKHLRNRLLQVREEKQTLLEPLL